MPTTIPAEALYRTSTLVESFAQIPSAPSFLKDNLFPRSVTSSSDLISVELFRGNEKLAAFVSRFSKGSAVPREREQLSLFSPPFIKPVRNLTADDLFYRSAPTPAAGGPENREVELLARGTRSFDLEARGMDGERVPVHGQGEVCQRRLGKNHRRVDLRNALKDRALEVVVRSRERSAQRSARRDASRRESVRLERRSRRDGFIGRRRVRVESKCAQRVRQDAHQSSSTDTGALLPPMPP